MTFSAQGWVGALGILAFACGHVFAQPEFVEVSGIRGLQPFAAADGMGTGAAAADSDDDGSVDLFVPTDSGTPARLYRNLGDGTFSDVAAAVGLDETDSAVAALWWDYDGDGDLDLAVACDDMCNAERRLRLYRQDDAGMFSDVTSSAGLHGLVTYYDGMHVGGMAAGDVNQDRYLDLILCYWEGETYLLINDGQGGFSNAAAASGMDTSIPYWTPMMHDVDRDGWLDIIQAVDFLPNILWLNQRDGTFTDVAAAAGVDDAFNDMGMALGDYDNDGDFDIYITNIYRDGKYNVLYRNDSTSESIIYTDVSADLDVEDGGWGWGATFLDGDNDGWIDLAATNGAWNAPWSTDPSRYWHNGGTTPASFVDASAVTGFDDTEWGSGLIAFDADRDGDLELLQVCANGLLRLLDNQLESSNASANHYLVVRPRMDGPNSHAIGAVIRATIGGTTHSRLITAGTSFLSQEPAEAFIGLDNATMVDALAIEWPDGSQSTHDDIAADQIVTTQHGGFGDLDADGDVDDTDLGLFEPCFAGAGVGGILYAEGCQPADMNGDGDVDCEDWRVIEAAYELDNGDRPAPALNDLVGVLLGIDTTPFKLCMTDMNADGANDARDIEAYLQVILTDG